VVAVGDVADRLVEAIAQRVPRLRIGDGAVETTDMGPLITAEHRERVAGYIDAGVQAGAKVVVDGRQADLPSEGFFLGATLLDLVKPDMSVYRDEIFGPVLSVVRCDTFDEAVKLINSNHFANGTAIFTRDGGAARQFQTEVEVGMIGINVPVPVPVAYYSFGGWKASLFGDSHMYGPEGINFYTRGKVVTSRWPDPANSKIDLGFPQTR
jgi:malonate-semialdehyde dehydrogenase (acetylating)/methylmalonate-semialdehyde dehydrogenase